MISSNNKALPKIQKTFRITVGHGSFARQEFVVVDCVEQGGMFYASMNTFNANAICVGRTEVEAFAAWASRCGGVEVETPAR